jgi:hypothetical protein
VRRQVGAAGAEPSPLTGEDQLRPDAVRRRGEQTAIVERIEAGEGAEALGPGGLDGRTKAIDDRLGRRE